MKGLFLSAKIKILFFVIASVLLFYTLLGFLILPMVLKNQIPKLAQQNLDRSAQIGDIQFNPFSMELNILGLEINNRKKGVFVRLKRVYTNVAVWQSIFEKTLKMDQVLIEQPYALVQRDNKGNLNFSDLLDDEKTENEKPSEGDDLFPVTISKLVIKEGKLNWEDSSQGHFKAEQIYPINLNIDNFTTQTNKDSQLGFSLMLASGGELDWQGEIKLVPFYSKGHIKLEKVDIHKVWELVLQDKVNFDLRRGSEFFEADYQLFENTKGWQLLVNNAGIDINDFQLAEKGGQEPLMDVPGLTISGLSLDLQKKNIEIDRVSGKDAQFKTWLNADGSINYQALFAGDNGNNDEPQKEQKSVQDDRQWQVNVQHLNLDNFALNFIDNTVPKPVHIELSSLNFDASGLSTKAGAELPFKLGLAVNKGGRLNVEGKTVLEPFSGQFNIIASDIAINDFQTYIDQLVRLDVISGVFNVNTQIAMVQTEDQPLAIRLQGNSQINDLVTRDRVAKKDFLNWKQLSLNNMVMDLSANSYSVETVKIEQPYARVLIRKDKSINLDDIALEKTSTEQKAVHQKQAPNQEAVKPSFTIGHIEMVKGESDFADLSLILPFSAHINQLKGSVKGISSDPSAIAKVELTGRMYELLPVIIQGQLNPYRGDSEFKLDFKSMPLPLMSPYMAEFAGRKIEKGNLSLALKYKIKNRQLSVSNSLLIDQLVLGDEVEHPEAVSLPLDLAIALLEDSDGKIALDVPIKGSLDHPEFSVGSVIVDALVNVITKIVTSPFNAIVSLIGDDVDVSKIEFTAGKAILPDTQQTKLDALSKALINRPGLSLEIEGTAFSKQDWPELQMEALGKQLRQIKLAELNQDNEEKLRLENITLTDEEYNDLLADLFIKKFPELAEKSFFGTPRLKDKQMGDFYEIAEQKLATIIPPDRHRLRKLAKLRAKNIAKHLVEKGVNIERVFFHDVDVDPKGAGEDIASILTLGMH